MRVPLMQQGAAFTALPSCGSLFSELDVLMGNKHESCSKKGGDISQDGPDALSSMQQKLHLALVFAG